MIKFIINEKGEVNTTYIVFARPIYGSLLYEASTNWWYVAALDESRNRYWSLCWDESVYHPACLALCCSPQWVENKGDHIMQTPFRIFNESEYIGGIDSMYGVSVLKPLYAYSPTTGKWHLREAMTLIWLEVPSQTIPANVRALAMVLQ